MLRPVQTTDHHRYDSDNTQTGPNSPNVESSAYTMSQLICSDIATTSYSGHSFSSHSLALQVHHTHNDIR
jgi:hypothetical protein